MIAIGYSDIFLNESDPDFRVEFHCFLNDIRKNME